jgi:hypothetical protein
MPTIMVAAMNGKEVLSVDGGRAPMRGFSYSKNIL